MIRMFQNLHAHRRGEEGASAVEYGLLVALIAAVIVVAVLLLGGVVKGAFTDTKSGICKSSTGSMATECAKTS
jgi:pilus assembly protein Flp/PilA